jgi:hypothetical protein
LPVFFAKAWLARRVNGALFLRAGRFLHEQRRLDQAGDVKLFRLWIFISMSLKRARASTVRPVSSKGKGGSSSLRAFPIQMG